MQRKRLGVITDGAFNAGLTARLDPSCSTESLRIGEFVVVEGDENTYFSMLSDMQLRATDVRLLSSPPSGASPFVMNALAGTSTYATVQVKPMLMMPKDDPHATLDELEGPPAGTDHPDAFRVCLCAASQNDFAAVFRSGRGCKLRNRYAAGPWTCRLSASRSLRRAVVGHLRTERDRQELPGTCAVVRHHPYRQRGQPDLRHAQRVCVRSPDRRRHLGSRPAPALRTTRRGLFAGQGSRGAPRAQRRCGSSHRSEPDQARGRPAALR